MLGDSNTPVHVALCRAPPAPGKEGPLTSRRGGTPPPRPPTSSVWGLCFQGSAPAPMNTPALDIVMDIGSYPLRTSCTRSYSEPHILIIINNKSSIPAVCPHVTEQLAAGTLLTSFTGRPVPALSSRDLARLTAPRSGIFY